jgi:hypothetical protein
MGLGEDLAMTHIIQLINVISGDTAENAKILEHCVQHLDEEPEIPGFHVEEMRAAGAHLCDALEHLIDCIDVPAWREEIIDESFADELKEAGRASVVELRKRLSGIPS